VTAGYDRRHFYTWAIEKRKLERSTQIRKGPKQKTSSVSNTQAKQFW
jgi:hypothetical protein